MSHLLAALVGSFVGMVSGLTPGLGIFASTILLFPFISSWPPIDVFLFYAALTQMSQFIGTVTTIYTGVPGEPSMMPAEKELRNLPLEKYGEAIAATSIGSFVSAIFAIGLCWVLAGHLVSVSYVLRTEFISLLFVCALAANIAFSRDKVWVSVLTTMLGIFLGLIGYNETLQVDFFTFGNTNLANGLPVDIAMVCLFAGPQLYQITKLRLNIRDVPVMLNWPKSVNYFRVILYSIIGFIGGLMPGLTMIFSSMLSYNITCRFTKDPLERIIAAESANNAGAVSQLIPLIVFGLPLVASEALMLGLMEQHGFRPSIQSAADMFRDTTMLQLIVSAAGMVLAWPLATQLLKILRMNITLVRSVTMTILVCSILYRGYVDYNIVFVLQSLVGLSIAGWLLRNRDTSGLVFGFLIAPQLVDYFNRLHQLYF